MTSPFKWYWNHGSEPESYQGGLATRDEAIAAARADDAHVSFTIVEANKKVPTTDIFTAEDVIERYEEHNEGCWGEDGSMIVAENAEKKELETMLSDALSAWMDKHDLHGRAFMFDDMRNEEYFPAERTAQ